MSCLAVQFVSILKGCRQKIVTNGRGGYCFEHASLMHFALEAIGFANGRDAKGENEDLPPYQIHQILSLNLTQILGLTAPALTGWQRRQ